MKPLLLFLLLIPAGVVNAEDIPARRTAEKIVVRMVDGQVQIDFQNGRYSHFEIMTRDRAQQFRDMLTSALEAK